MGEIKLDGFLCDRCDHTWFGRNGNSDAVKKPTVCPKCKSPYWNVPRKEKVTQPARTQETFGLFPSLKKVDKGDELWKKKD